MLIVYFLMRPVFWILPWILQALAYFKILKKMELKPWPAVVPVLGEYQLSRRLFPKRRSFFRPLILTAIMVGFAWYLDPYSGTGRIFMLVAFAIYGIFLIRLYRRLAKAFGKKAGFVLGLIVLPPLFLLILGFGKAVYTQPVFKPEKVRSKGRRIAAGVGFVAVSAIEVAAIVAGAGFLTIQQKVPGIVVKMVMEQVYDATKDITDGGEVVTRADVLGDEGETLADSLRSRDYYFPDHSQDQSVVVMTYIVGADLESRSGLASMNIQQMLDASKQGSGLRFIVEAGGSERWFTNGIANGSYGRYEIADGKITQIESLPETTNMSDGATLEDFIRWAAENYEADRYMLTLWDHGGGMVYGYGLDQINSQGTDCIKVSALADALEGAGVKFDIIGFDACLMQEIEIAKALAPYADYLLASEETESGCGWFYTYAYGCLAKDPGMSSEDFGRALIAGYDPYNMVLSENGQPVSTVTLSLVDLTVAEGAYDLMADFMAEAAEAIPEDPAAYADMAIAADNAYAFSGSQQIDLIDFLEILDETDYDDSIGTHEEKTALIEAASACVLCRNGASAEGINGLAMAFPYNSIYNYTNTSAEFGTLSMDEEKLALDEVFSIMAAQKAKAAAADMEDDENAALASILYDLMGIQTDYTKEAWYIEGFEDYDDTTTFVDIPLLEKADGYQVQLPENTWDIVTDCQTMVWQQTEDGPEGAVRRYLGCDYIGDDDENGHPLITADNYWVHVNGQLACYITDQILVVDEDTIYTGRIPARLNDSEDIYLLVTWDPLDDDEDLLETGHITGYISMDDTAVLEDKGASELQAGDTIQLLFDYYDAEGRLVATEPAGDKIRVSRQSRLNVADQAMSNCVIEYAGSLEDVYQRRLLTEYISLTIE